MNINHPNMPLSLEIKQDRLFMMRNSVPVLTSALLPNIVRESGDERHMQIEFKSSSMTLQTNESGFDLTFSPAGRISLAMDGTWFGQGELIHQILPLNKLMMRSSELLTFDNSPTGLSGKLTPGWFSSNGVLIIAHTPVEVGINQPPTSTDFPRFAWDLGPGQAPFSTRPFPDEDGAGDGLLTLTGEGLHISISLFDDAVNACRKLIAHYGKPSNIPDASLFDQPTWTTWARYKTAISQEVILQFADEIVQRGYPRNVLEIDDKWQSNYGDLAFNPKLFPDPKEMVEQLHGMRFKVTAWVIPFFEPHSTGFSQAAMNNWLVKRSDGSPYLVQWWQGKGGLLDITNPEAVDWFFKRLRKLQADYGLDGYKFDAGEACFFPRDAVTSEQIHPNDYTHRYVSEIAKRYSLTEVRSGWKNQTAPIFFRQWDKATSWGLDNGMHSVLTSALSMSMTGYPFILPDMIGGNAYIHQPDAELMIRWTQLNALLPSMQFSLAPWDYGEECADICRRFIELHLEFAPLIIELARNAVETGDPIIRPVWWLAPHDERALFCDDEILLGDDILVAPVIKQGAVRRDILLPPGLWQDINTGVEYDGDQIIRDFPAPLDTLPVFQKIILDNKWQSM